MPRIRTVKPEFYQDEDLAGVSETAFILALGLLNQADDEGYFRANPMLIKSQVFPLREPSVSIHGALSELSNIGFIDLFDGSDGKNYGLIASFTKHQTINRPTPSNIKGLRGITEDSLSAHGELTVGKERKGKERKGKFPPNPPRGEKRFKPPTVDEVTEYKKTRSSDVDPESFVDFYQSKNWYVGKNKMKCWKSAFRTWEKRDKQTEPIESYEQRTGITGVII